MTRTSIQREADQSFTFKFTSFAILTLPKAPDIFTFDSRSEAVCAIILEKYIPDWQVKRGRTWQIALPEDKFADFRVGDTIIEFHPIDLKHEMRPGEFYKFKRKLHSIDPKYARDYEDSIKEEKCKLYEQKRRDVLDKSIELQHCRLKVCCNDEAFANVVSKLIKNRVPAQEILKEWRQCFQSL